MDEIENLFKKNWLNYPKKNNGLDGIDGLFKIDWIILKVNERIKWIEWNWGFIQKLVGLS